MTRARDAINEAERLILYGFTADELALQIEMIVDVGMNCGELLKGLHASKPLHGPLSPSKRELL